MSFFTALDGGLRGLLGTSSAWAVLGRGGRIGPGLLSLLVLVVHGLHAQPVNDDFDEATVIPGGTTSATFTGNTVGGTVEPGEPSHAGVTSRKSVWWSWRPHYGGKTTIGIVPGSRLRRIAVYRGDLLASLEPVASIRTSPYRVEFDSVRGEPYAIAFDELTGASGQTVDFTWLLDHRTLRIVMPSGGPYLEGDTIPLAVEPYDPLLPLPQVDYIANGALVGSATAWPWTLDWVSVGANSYELTAVGIDLFGDTHPSLPASMLVGSRNDRFADARELLLDEGTNTFVAITTYATAEPGEPTHGLVSSAVRSLWWRWTAPWSGQAAVTIREFGSLHAVGVYTGEEVDQLTAEPSVKPVAGGFMFNVVAGRTYRLAVEGGYNAPDVGCEVTVNYCALAPMLPTDGFAATLPARIRADYFRPGTSPSEVTFVVARDLGWGTYDTPQVIGTSGAAPFEADWLPPWHGTYQIRLSVRFPDGRILESIPGTFPVAVVNDHFAGAQVLNVGPVGARYSNGWGAAQVGEPAHGGQPPIQTQWWQWTAPLDGMAYMSIAPYNWRRALAVYTGTSVTDLTLVADNRPTRGNDPALTFQFAVTQGQIYRIVMGLWPGEPVLETDWSLDFRPFFLSEPATFRFAPVGQPLELEARLFDPSLTNFWGADVVLVAAKWSQDPSFLQRFGAPPYRATWVPTVPGIYRISGTIGHYGTYPVVVQVTPENDAFASPTRLSQEDCGWVGRGNSAGSTLEPGETQVDPTDGSIWFEWMPPEDGPIGLYLWGGGENRLIVYEGDSLTSLTDLAQSSAQIWFRSPTRKGNPLRLGIRSFRHPTMPTEDNGSPVEIRMFQLARNDAFERAQPLILRDTGAGYPMERFGFTNVHTLEGGLWWDWTAPADGDFWVETSESGEYGRVSLQTGDSATNLVWAYNNYANRGQPARIVAKAGTTYHLAMVGSHVGNPICRPVDASAVFVPNPTRPVNDNFAQRTPLTGARVGLTVSLASASAEPGEPGTSDANLWWSYTAPRAGVLTVTVTAEGYQPTVHVFRGDRLETLQNVGQWWNSAVAELAVQAGETVQIRVGEPRHSFFAPLSSVKLQVELVTPAPPPNDNFAQRIMLTGANWAQSGRIDGATFEAGEFAWTPGATLWWTFTAPSVGILRLRVAEAGFGAHLTAYAEGIFPDLNPLRGRFEPLTELWLEPMARMTIHFSLESYDRLLGSFTLTGDFLSAPDNDAFVDRKSLGGRHVVVEGFNTGASLEPGEPTHAPFTFGQSLWWTWTAPISGPVDLTPEWSSFAFAVYQGPSLGGLQRVTTSEPAPSVVRFEAVAGQPYQLAVDAIGTPGYLRFRLDMRNPPASGGRLEFVRHWTDGTIEWRHSGEPGYRYQIESKGASGAWQPLVFLDQTTGTATFLAPLSLSETSVFYRARGVD